ncbi:TetR family transcriptional regulator [Actinorhabdospora filicis]|uniref:TetR family transcriptional regulator n=1 Tax=Actinorhabdospora filicis TaxID=1785913 RepID=A0A9W6SE59_9ACTN|nr:TetR family transcriptional regulator [Actinorhabdospora filicis]GLZ75569.1 TetR family transcriptional regulator [Actinorhabdospora filicis]
MAVREHTGAEDRQRRTRQQIAASALALFAEQGYADTTVDQIAAAAGVARRTFFRYFPGKDDAIFPDHDETLARVAAVLDGADALEEPLSVVYRGIREVLRMYAADPKASVARYRLLREVPALREREIAVVSRYERLFTRYLLDHADRAIGEHEDAPLLAEVAAAAIVAAHNHVLRQWLRAAGEGDVEARLESAVGIIRRRLAREGGDLDGAATVVVVTRADADPSEVADRVRKALEG